MCPYPSCQALHLWRPYRYSAAHHMQKTQACCAIHTQVLKTTHAGVLLWLTKGLDATSKHQWPIEPPK
jgi:hypothetical protein